MEETDPRKVLQEGVYAFKNKDYERSLECYEWYFENSTKIRKSLVGSRLSFCLGYWAELAQHHPPALGSLKKKRDVALENLKKENNQLLFYEYRNICHFLKEDNAPLELFLKYDIDDPQFADQLFGIMQKDLAKLNKWTTCNKYITDAQQFYGELIETLDEDLKCPSEAPEELMAKVKEAHEQYIVNKASEDFLFLLTVLSKNQRIDEYNDILNRLQDDLKKRKREDIYQNIKQELPVE